MTNQDAPDRIWIEEDDGCPYFYDASELAEAGGPLIEYIRADLAARRSAPPVGARVTGWQPIETAPKDGVTEVLMYDPVLGMAVWPSANSPWPNVTHWMPLPDPPAALLPAGEGE